MSIRDKRIIYFSTHFSVRYSLFNENLLQLLLYIQLKKKKISNTKMIHRKCVFYNEKFTRYYKNRRISIKLETIRGVF